MDTFQMTNCAHCRHNDWSCSVAKGVMQRTCNRCGNADTAPTIPPVGQGSQTADRIEELVKENHQLATALAGCNIAWDQALHQRDEAKAKLAKAVEVLRNRMHCHDCSCGECDHIRDTLAELEKDT